MSACGNLIVINPRRACAQRVTVVCRLHVCLSFCLCVCHVLSLAHQHPNLYVFRLVALKQRLKFGRFCKEVFVLQIEKATYVQLAS